MTDIHSKKTRSYNMSQIKSKDTKPELLVRKFLFANGLRYRLHDKKLSGKPDIVFKKLKTIIFIHGCFWHGHSNCKYYVIPKTRTNWWLEKIERNKEIDSKNFTKLTAEGWKIFTIFECELKGEKKDQTLSELLIQINSIQNDKTN